MDVAARFRAAAIAAPSLPAAAVTNDSKLKLYALYKQATVGPAPATAAASAFDLAGRMKHQAWASIRELSPQESQKQYVELYDRLRAREPPAAAKLDGREAAASSLTLTVRFHEIRHTQTYRGSEAYAVYEVHTLEGECEWTSYVRWSDMARMWDELSLFYRAALRSAKGSLPSFHRHSMTKSKVDKALCVQRALTMEQLLRSLVRAMGVSVLRGWGPWPLRAFVSFGGDIEKPTPKGFWYTVDGWPQVAVESCAAKCAPRSLVPPADYR